VYKNASDGCLFPTAREKRQTPHHFPDERLPFFVIFSYIFPFARI